MSFLKYVIIVALETFFSWLYLVYLHALSPRRKLYGLKYVFNR